MRLRRPFAAAVSGLLLALSGCSRSGETAPAGPPPPVVEVVTVTPRALANEADLLGQLNAVQQVTVRSEVSGIVAAIEFREGEAVHRGQLLFRLRDDEQVARRHEAETALRLADANHRRMQDLSHDGIVAPSQLDDATAQLEAARARLEVARVAVDRTRITAPFDGYAGHRLVSLGARIEPENDLVTVESIADLELAFQLPELAMPLARVGVPVDIRVAPYPDRVFSGAISFVAPSLNPQNRRLLVKARIPNPDLTLRPGLFATVEARLGTRENVLAVPDSAVVYGSTGAFVWRIDAAQKAVPVDVALGLRRHGIVEVTSGLRAGDVVVVAGTNKLAPGIGVEAVAADAKPTASPGARP
ncbi:MAG: efflux RND transporter periplasmic adaptor subunit [Deltaproteobacteria bacterium]|nr:efflux RND transporter periplasmic adaptor subunit [Deltaproteobacteria bacterium]